jgi:pilus assembly protein Flp/PilA
MARPLNLFLTRKPDSFLVRPQDAGGTTMKSTFVKELVDDTSGATAIEYGLIVALVVIAMIAALQGVANATIDMWDRVESESVGAMQN